MSENITPSGHGTGAPARIAQVGAGGMGKAWLRMLLGRDDAELVGLVDLNTDAAEAALAEVGAVGVPVARSLAELSEILTARGTDITAVVNVTVPVAHLPVTLDALALGLPVLCEKPAAPTVAETLVMVAAAADADRLVMISQSRRYFAALDAFVDAVHNPAGTDGVGILTTDFGKAPHFGGFREEMEHVLLVDMAVHSFDAARLLLRQEPVSVFCQEWNPEWSWFARDAAANAVFEFDGGARYRYSGSWVSDGDETSWNGRWRATGRGGTAVWDGDNAPELFPAGSHEGQVLPVASGVHQEITGAFSEFLLAIEPGSDRPVPASAIAGNVSTLAMVEAAVRSAETGSVVLIADVLDEAFAQARSRSWSPGADRVLAQAADVAELRGLQVHV
ncbi:MAG: Gfo/Idh/MocA family protein [Mycetocola sp.]